MVNEKLHFQAISFFDVLVEKITTQSHQKITYFLLNTTFRKRL